MRVYITDSDLCRLLGIDEEVFKESTTYEKIDLLNDNIFDKIPNAKFKRGHDRAGVLYVLNIIKDEDLN